MLTVLWKLSVMVQSQMTRLPIRDRPLCMVRDMLYPVASFTTLSVLVKSWRQMGLRNNLRGTFLTPDCSVWLLSLPIYILCLSRTFSLNCLYVWEFFGMCVGDIIIGVIGVWGMTNCVWWMCRLADREGGEGSEDRTSLRGVAVNPWPCWLSLQGGGGRGGSGGHFEVRLVQGHMMAGRGGVVRCLIWFLSVRRFHLPHHPSSENRVWEAGQCQREVTYFMSHLKGMVVPPHKGNAEKQQRAHECHDTQSHVCLQDATLLFPHHKLQFSSSKWHLNNALSLCPITS